ncbi:MAG TPA: A/G-specific adenine glycosylase [Bacteroidales bacterium]|nr:A/G-specific adenine glycosylase [Bacteroidales bacterium]
MNSLSGISILSTLLSEWYEVHQRDLPWRRNPEPYPVWISEIILQQTRVEQGLPYYESILARFPDVKSLAEAPLDDLLKQWQGLGYYSRARNMHLAAKQIVNEFGGQFPKNYETLLKLKGVGDYTAAAIASIVYGEPKAVVDGNVYRVLARLFNIDTPINSSEGKRIFAKLATEILDREHPANHNQAIMEFGALHCVPVRPNCATCTLAVHCLGLAAGRVAELPVKSRGATKQERYFWYFVPTDGKHTWLQQRLKKDIWQNLWEFPLLEPLENQTLEKMLQDPQLKVWFKEHYAVGNPLHFKHILSHRVIHATFLPIQIPSTTLVPEAWTKVSVHQIDSFAISKMTEAFLHKYTFI